MLLITLYSLTPVRKVAGNTFLKEQFMIEFSQIIIPEPIQRAAADLNFVNPTAIQEQAIPWIMEYEQDLIALAQTGTGKTAAYGFPVLAMTDTESKLVQTLIVCPTRELSLQIYNDFQNFAKYLPRIKCAVIYGGASISRQKDVLKAGVQIVIGTPGRLNDMINQNILKIDRINMLILDEADEMLNIGFKDDIERILSNTPAEKQTLLFSATMSAEIELLARQYLKNPHRISAGTENRGAENIRHFYFKTESTKKYLVLKRVADMNPNIYGIVFCRTRKETQEIASKLQQDGYNADSLHGDLSQGQREFVMKRFRSKYVRLLIATDVAARGIDVDDLTHIINYHLPKEPGIYIHRTGRTGRAGKNGTALSIINNKEESALKMIERKLGKEIIFRTLPTGREICEKRLFHFIDTVERVEVDCQQIESFLPKIYKKLNWMTHQELIQRFVSVEFNYFLNYYKENEDLQEVKSKRERKKKSFYEFSLFRLNIGSKQNLSKKDLMNLINNLRVSRNIEIGRIVINDNSSTVELDARHERELLKSLNRSNYRGISLKAAV